MPTSKRRRKAASSADTLRVRDFELLIALHETGNLTEAAERVGITEPAASSRLKVIQRAFKIPLYKSGNGGGAFTEAGLAVLGAAVDIVQAFHRGTHEANEALHGRQHLLRVGVSSFLPVRWHGLLQSVPMRVHRNATVHLDLAYTEQLLLALRRHDLDVVLVTSPPDTGKITSHCVAKSSFSIVFREGHALAARESLSLSDVLDYPWILFHRSVHPWLHDLILRRAEVAGGSVRIKHRVNHSDHVPRLLTDDGMLAWLTPAGAEHIAQPGIVSRPLDDPEIRLETHLAALASNMSPLVAEYFKCFLKRVEEDQSPVQLTLPMPLPDHDGIGLRQVLMMPA